MTEATAISAPPIRVMEHGRTNEFSPAARRAVAALILLVCTGVLGLAAVLEPSSQGLGTHESLGMPPCGWITTMDLPCPTCGMTTSFAHTANGDFGQAFLAQPFGLLLALATTMTLLTSLHVLITGHRLGKWFGRLWFPRAGWVIAGLVLAAWLFKVVQYRAIL